MPKQFQFQELAFVPFVPPSPPAETSSTDFLQLLPRKYFQYDPSPFVFLPPPQITPLTPESWKPTYPHYFPALRMVESEYGQVAFVYLPPAATTALVPLSWSPNAPVYFPALRMAQDGFNQFVPTVMTPPIPPPGGSGSNNYVITFIPTNALPIG